MHYGRNKIHKLTLTAVLTAIIFVLAFTPLGYLVIGPIAATTVQIPVIIGAIVLGPAYGAALGGFFGLSAIIKVLSMPGADPFASMAMAHAPLNYIIICMGSRIAMGLLTGILAELLQKAPVTKKAPSLMRFGITGFLGSMLNTVFYLGLLWLLAAEVIAVSYGVDLSSVGNIVITTAVTAGIPEAVFSCIIVHAVCRALAMVFK